MGGGAAELSNEEQLLLSKHAVLQERQKQLEELKVEYKEMQEKMKKNSLSENSAMIQAANNPSQVTEIAKKLAASGKLVTDKKNAGFKTSGFKRQARPAAVIEEQKTKLENRKQDAESAMESEAAVGSLMSDLGDTKQSSPGGTNSPVDKVSNFTPLNKKPRMSFVKGETAFNSPSPSGNNNNRGTTQSRTSFDEVRKAPFGDAKQSIEQNKGNTIFIRNSGLTETVLNNLCKPFGKIHSVSFDRNGKGFVTFTSFQAADQAIEKLHSLELTEEHFGDELAALAQVSEMKLFVTYAKKQRHVNLATDLKHDWAKISADVKTSDSPASSNSGTGSGKSTAAQNRSQRVYDDDPF